VRDDETGAEPALDRYADSFVMLLPTAAFGPAIAWAHALSKRMRVVVVTADGGGVGTTPVNPRLIRLSVPPSATGDAGERLSSELRKLGLIKPVVWLEDPAYDTWFCRTYAAFKVVACGEQSGQPYRAPIAHANAMLRTAPVDTVTAQRGANNEDIWTLPLEPTEEAVTSLSRLVARSLASRPPADARLNVAILYDHSSTHTNTVREYLTAFAEYSRHRVYYVPASNYHPRSPEQVDLSIFDVVIIHYSIRLCFRCLDPTYAAALERFSGLMLCFIQDEYDLTEIARQQFEKLGVHVLFTCVPEAYRESVYPTDRFPHVEFVHVLTGYVPLYLEALAPRKAMKDRRFVLGYRGRSLPVWYGELSREKFLIGQAVREACVRRGIPVDIECDEEHRIYGEQWYAFMQDCRATLGTESGSNVFDDHGDIRGAIQRALKRDPDLSYETLYQRYVAAHEGPVRMNQISPRIFEAIALRTALVLFEGEYSAVVQPEVHYIPLKKDLSNLDDVLERLADDDYLERLTTRAWNDIIGSGRYSYRSFIAMVDATIDRHNYNGTSTHLLTAVVASRRAGEPHWEWRPMDQALATFAGFTTELIDFQQRPPRDAVPPAALSSRIEVTSPAPALQAGPSVADATPPIPLDPLQALKWNVADLLYRHKVVYVVARAAFRVLRVGLAPVRWFRRSLVRASSDPDQGGGNAIGAPDARP
jgi:hypothetical protein